MTKVAALALRFYLFYFLAWFAPWYLFFNLIGTQSGILPSQIAICIAIKGLTSFLFEIPSGVWADKFSRKKMIFVSRILIVSCLALLLLCKVNFLLFAIISFLFGVGNSLISGTLEAFLYDELKHLNASDQYAKIFSRTGFFNSFGFGFASISCIFLSDYDYKVNLWISFVVAILSLIVFLFQSENREKGDISHGSTFLSVLKSGSFLILSNRILLRLTVFATTYCAASELMGEFWTNIGSSEHLSLKAISVTAAIQLFLEGFIKAFTYKFHLSLRQMLLTSVIVCLVFIFIAIFFYNKWFIAIMWPFFAFDVYMHNRTNAILQESTESSTRATILSCYGCFGTINASLFAMVAGYIIDLFGYQVSIIFSMSIVAVLSSFILVKSFFVK